MDNFITSVPSILEATDLYRETNEVFDKVSMQLAQWGSNLPEVESLFTPEQALNKNTVKILGLLWDKPSDKIFLSPKIKRQTVYTKASFVSAFSSLYDPLGWFSPLLVSFKAILKTLWDLKSDWKDPLPPEFQEIAPQLVHELIKATNLCFDRKMFTLPFNPDYLEMHVFADASKVTYSVVTYFRLHHPTYGKAEIAIVMGKARSSPKTEQSIPRLELVAAVIGSRLIQFLREYLQIKVPTYLWSDSKCVLV